MPTCKKCNYMASSADMRRSPTSGYLCKDSATCKRRQKTLKPAGKSG